MQVHGGYHLQGLLDHLDGSPTVGLLVRLLADFPSVLLMRRILASNGKPHEITKAQWKSIQKELLETYRLDPNEPGGIYIRLFFRTARQWRAEFDAFMEKSEDGNRYEGQNVRKLRILITHWLEKYSGIKADTQLSISYIGQTIRTVAERMDEENNPDVLDGAIANAVFTRFFGKGGGKKKTPDLSIKVRLGYIQQNMFVFVFDLFSSISPVLTDSFRLLVSVVMKMLGWYDLHRSERGRDEGGSICCSSQWVLNCRWPSYAKADALHP